MATPDKLLIVQPKNRVVGVQELWVEDDLDAVRGPVEQLNPSDLVQDWVVGVVRHVVGRNGRERVPLECEYAPFKEDLVFLAEQGRRVGNFGTVFAEMSAEP